MVKTHRLRFHHLNLLSHLLDTQHFGEPKRFPAKKPLDVLPLDKRNVLSELRAVGSHESLGMHQFFVLHDFEHFRGVRIIRLQPVGIVPVNASVVLFERDSQSQNLPFAQFGKCFGHALRLVRWFLNANNTSQTLQFSLSVGAPSVSATSLSPPYFARLMVMV